MAEKVDCPVCGNIFSAEEIANHVDKCLFLNSSNDKNVSFKRSNLPTKSPNSGKRLKTEIPECSVMDFKVPSQMLEADESFSKKSDDLKDMTPRKVNDNNTPLAELMRPSDMSQFVGQKHVLGQDKVLFKLIQNENIPSMILWGPPGCGKTTLAHIIAAKAKHCKNPFKFIKLSATMDGVKDVKEIVKLAKNELSMFKRKTLLFMDEIHRFNKMQQDIFLPHVESGLITLIGATTENPSFSLNSALLSRCAVIVLEKLSSDDLHSLLCRAVHKLGGIVNEKNNELLQRHSEETEVARFSIDDASLRWLSEMCDGDARIVLNSLNIALQTVSYSNNIGNDTPKITLEEIKDGVKRSHMLYDKKGDEHYNTISALHKSLRAGDDNATLYWLARMLEGGEDPMFIARRLVRAASEDVGLADPLALQLAVSTMQGCQLIGMPECDVLLAQCAVYLSRAPKSREMDNAIAKARECVRTHKGPLPPIPLYLRNAPTRLMKDLDYSKGYNMLPKEKSGLTYMPDGLQGVDFFQ